MDIDKFLINSGQSETNDEIKSGCILIPEINCVEDLKKLDQIFFNYFKKDDTTPKFSRSVIEIFKSKTFSGCSDIGLMMSSILREKGIPTVYVETAQLGWLNKAINGLPGSECMEGHIFLEVQIDNKWFLYDPTFHMVYDDYDMDNNNYPRGYYAFAKGRNANELGVYSVKEERELALARLKNYDYQHYVDPEYPEVNLKFGETKNIRVI